MQVGHHDDVVGSDGGVVRSKIKVLGQNQHASGGLIFCNDSQEIRYSVDEIDADGDVIAQFFITGYWMWE